MTYFPWLVAKAEVEMYRGSASHDYMKSLCQGICHVPLSLSIRRGGVICIMLLVWGLWCVAVLWCIHRKSDLDTGCGLGGRCLGQSCRPRLARCLRTSSPNLNEFLIARPLFVCNYRLIFVLSLSFSFMFTPRECYLRWHRMIFGSFSQHKHMFL